MRSCLMNIEMTGLRLLTKFFASLCFGRKTSLSIGRVNGKAVTQVTTQVAVSMGRVNGDAVT